MLMSKFLNIMFLAGIANLLGCTNGKFQYLDYRERLYTCQMGFFVTSDTVNGAIGVAGADAQCKATASRVGDCGKRPWRAYLSTSTGNARDRIGNGPWYNVAGQLMAKDVQSLYASTPTSTLFLTEQGQDASAVNIWTGSTTSGTASGNTCNDFTTSSSGVSGQFADPISQWSDTFNQSCDTLSRLYCFASD